MKILQKYHQVNCVLQRTNCRALRIQRVCNGRLVAGKFYAILLMPVWRGTKYISSMRSWNSSPSIAAISLVLLVSLHSYLAIVSWCSRSINVSPLASLTSIHLLSRTSQLDEHSCTIRNSKKNVNCVEIMVHIIAVNTLLSCSCATTNTTTAMVFLLTKSTQQVKERNWKKVWSRAVICNHGGGGVAMDQVCMVVRAESHLLHLSVICS